MNTSDPLDSIAVDSMALAADEGLSGATEFLSALPEPDSTGVDVLVAQSVDPEPLIEWLAGIGRVQLRISRLESVVPDPGLALRSNRALVALGAGALLTPDMVDAVHEVLRRPVESWRVAVVGAEAIQDEEDLAAVTGGLWRSLIGQDQARWMGQDLAEHGFLLWSLYPSGVIAARVERDVQQLQAWLAGSRTHTAELTRLRLGHALDILEQALAVRDRTPQRRPLPRSDLLGAISDLHRRALARVDAEAAAMEAEVDASLRLLEQDLASDLTTHLGGRSAELTSAPAVERMVADYIHAEVSTWMVTTKDVLQARLNRVEETLLLMFDGIEWPLVNQAVEQRGAGPYPETLTAVLRPESVLALQRPAVSPGSLLLTKRRMWEATARTAALGGALAGVSVLTLGPTIVPAVIAAAVGAVGGGLIERHLDAVTMAHRAQAYAQAAVPAPIRSLGGSVREAISLAIGPSRERLDAEFRRLEHELRAADTTASPRPGAAPAQDSTAARIGELRRRLADAVSTEASP